MHEIIIFNNLLIRSHLQASAPIINFLKAKECQKGFVFLKGNY